MWSNRDRHVPKDSVIEILLRLPVKSLLRFKCVCKNWYGLIKNPSFISMHFHHPSNSARLLVQYNNFDTQRAAFYLFPDEKLAGVPPVRQHLDHLEIPKMAYFSEIDGPFDGLFFLYSGRGGRDDDRLALWNPATREFRRLPVPRCDLPPHFISYIYAFGFGLDPLTNDYKVVWIRAYWDEEQDTLYRPVVVTVYTLGNNSWRHLDTFLDPNCCPDKGGLSNTCVNGAYYWLSGYNSSNHRIFSFDMGSEVFREIQGPDIPESKSGDLLLYNGSIALFLYELGMFDTSLSDLLLTSFIDIWVMKKEGCWIKLLTVGPLQEVRWPLGFWKTGELFFETSTSQLVLYDPNTHEIRNLGTCECPDSACLYCYKESLVSVKGGDEDWERGNISDAVRDFFITDEELQSYWEQNYLSDTIFGDLFRS